MSGPALPSLAHADTYTDAAASRANSQVDPSRSGRIPDELKPGGEFDRFVAKLAVKDEFSGTVLLMHRGKRVLERSYRMADKQRQVPNGPETIFCLGSIPKMFTGVAIGQLAEQGKVAYHEKLGAYLDGFAPEIADNVTVHHLLTHSSGLGDFHRIPGFFEGARTWTTVEEFWNGLMAFVRKDELAFTPGSSSDYSNTGYVALGAIVQEVSGKTYYDYIRDHLFTPAGMASTDFYTTDEWRDDRRIAHPYGRNGDGEWVDVLDKNVLIGTPAGGAFATTTDLVRFADALMGNELLDPAYTHLVTSPKLPVGSGEGAGFATYAPSSHLLRDQWVLGHNGGSEGVSANVDWFPDSSWRVVVLSNYGDHAARPAYLLARDLITSLARNLITGRRPNS